MSNLRAVVQHHLPDLRTLSEERAAHQPGPGVWSAKQMPGHLIDSGVNHHARVVRAGAEDGLSLAGYDQTAWEVEGHDQERPWTEMAQRAPTPSLGSGEPVTLDFLALDDVRQPLHQLAQISGRVGA